VCEQSHVRIDRDVVAAAERLDQQRVADRFAAGDSQDSVVAKAQLHPIRTDVPVDEAVARTADQMSAPSRRSTCRYRGRRSS
jgi:hypothetical protein